MTLEELKFWLGIANVVGTAALGAFMILSKRNDQTGARVGQIEERLIKVEANLTHMPTHVEIVKLGTDITRLQGETITQTELLTRMERQMGRINDWMLENK